MASQRNVFAFQKGVILCTILATIAAQDPSVVTDNNATIFGETVDFEFAEFAIQKKVDVYRGIPYAEPPVGDLRFKAPVKKVLTGVYNATHFRPMCPQVIFHVPGMQPPLEAQDRSEDCLHLNVFVPQSLATPAAVMVWIHGGGYVDNAGPSESLYDGSALASVGDVIVVTIKYRLGALGFLSTSDSVSRGNYGIMDQAMALEWVQDNIAAFGGDPGNVTIFGESAGAGSVGVHLISPKSNGLFARAITQSGTAISPTLLETDFEQMNARAHALGSLVNCDVGGSEKLVECLRDVGVEDLVRAQGQVTGIVGDNERAFLPVVDGDIIPKNPADILKDGSFNRVDAMFGANGDEGMYQVYLAHREWANQTDPYVSKEEFEALLQARLYNYGQLENEVLMESIYFMYTDWETAPNPNANYRHGFSQAFGDEMFVCPTETYARAYANSGATVYRYHFTHWPSKSFFGITWSGATHAEDLPYVFCWHCFPRLNWNLTDTEAKLTMNIIKYWTNFAKSRNPNIPDTENTRTDWTEFIMPNMTYLELSTESKMAAAVRATECAFWNDFFPQLKALTDVDVQPTKHTSKASSVCMGTASLVLLSLMVAISM
ncbi:acetylcholinesterase-like [Ptychodera flava]|uniref:acetylcholinesterase-like n=1 Tax=Ptychodera flava TaxID=63121 RepID=UPI00396A53EE